MRVDAVASSIKPLMKYANRDDVIEIAVRDGKKRFKAFYKVLLKDLQEILFRYILVLLKY